MTADTHPDRCAKAPRPFGDEPLGRILVPRAEWHRCKVCGATFAAREGLRGHRRFGRCLTGKDPEDEGRVVAGREGLK